MGAADRAPGEVPGPHRRPADRRAAPRALLRQPAAPGRGPVAGGADLAAAGRLPGAHRPRRLGRPAGLDNRHRARLHRGRDRRAERPRAGLPAQPGARAQPADAAVPLAGLGQRDRAQPDGEERDRDARHRPRDRPDVQLPGAPGGGHPVLPRQPGARRSGPAAARGDHPQDRPHVQQDLQPAPALLPGAGAAVRRGADAARHRRQEDGQERPQRDLHPGRRGDDGGGAEEGRHRLRPAHRVRPGEPADGRQPAAARCACRRDDAGGGRRRDRLRRLGDGSRRT